MSPNSTTERILELSAEAQIKRREAAEDSPAQLDRSDSGLWQNTWPSVKTQRSADETLLKQLVTCEMS